MPGVGKPIIGRSRENKKMRIGVGGNGGKDT